jgi:ABC-type dipeptide/oligopeptide/nickel transport system permease component
VIEPSAVDAILGRDYPIILGAVLSMAGVVLRVNLVVDVL